MPTIAGIALLLLSAEGFKDLPPSQKMFLAHLLEGKPVSSFDPYRAGVGTCAKMQVGFKVRQVMSKSMLLVDIFDNDFIVRGLDTSGYSEDRQYSSRGWPVCIAETYSFTTVLGANRTLPVIDVLGEDFEKTFVLALQVQAFREWPEVGKSRFLKLSGSTVHLETADGKPITIPASKLSDADRTWMRKHTAEQKKTIEIWTKAKLLTK